MFILFVFHSLGFGPRIRTSSWNGNSRRRGGRAIVATKGPRETIKPLEGSRLIRIPCSESAAGPPREQRTAPSGPASFPKRHTSHRPNKSYVVLLLFV